MMKQRLLILLFFLQTCLVAQSINFSGNVNRNAVSLGETFNYELVISGYDTNQVPDPKLPDLRSMFNIVSSREGQSFSWVNGAMSVSKTKTFILSPIKEGNFIIPEASLTLNGQQFKTQPITISVRPAAAQPQSVASSAGRSSAPSQSAPSIQRAKAGNVFLEAEVDKKSLYFGQDITYVLKFYRRVQLLSNLSLEEPSFQGFLSETLEPDQSRQVVDVNGLRYYVVELVKKSLTPIQAGTLTIDASRVGYVINFFDGQRVVESAPLTIEIKALPKENKPDKFSGLVGDFSISAVADKSEVNPNSPVSVRVEVTGKGNLRGLSDLVFESSPDYKFYKSQVSDVQLNADGSQTKTLDYIYIPKVSGKLSIPSFELSYFSPDTSEYGVKKTEPIAITSLKLAGDVAEVASAPVSEPSSTASKEQIQVIREDIQYVRSAFDVTDTYVPFSKSIVFWAFIYFNLAALFGFGFYKVKPYIFKTDIVKVKQTKAGAAAKKKLEKIVTSSLATKECISQLENVLFDFLSDKFGSSVRGLAKQDLVAELYKQNVHPDHLKMVTSVMDMLSFLAYAPSEQSQEKVKEISKDLIRIFEAF